MSLTDLLSSAKSLVAAEVTQAALPTGHPICTLFFSLSDGASRARVCSASGNDFAAAWQAAAAQTQKLVNRHELTVRWLRIDWVTDVSSASWGELAAEFSKTKRNYFRYGLAFDARFKNALLEQEINANAILYASGDFANAQFNQKNFAVYVKQRFGADFKPDLSPTAPVWQFATVGLFFSADARIQPLPGGAAPQFLPGPSRDMSAWRNPSTLDCGRRKLPALDMGDTFALIQSSSEFLARQVQEKGQFVYGHFPCFGRTIPTYNALRHASSVYSMLEAWELTRDEKLLTAIRRALDYLVDTLIRRYPQASGHTLAFNVDINGEIKLGANAVSILALVKYDELTGDTRHRPLMEQLAQGIAQMQDTATGKFVHVLNAEDLSVKEAFRIVYYDGEAAFGLMRLYGLTRDPRWLVIVERAFDYFLQANHWQHHDHWLSYCANELTLYRPEEKYFRFGVQNIAGYLDFILQRETTYPTLLELSMAFEAMLRRIENDHPQMRHVLDELDINKFHRALHHRAHYLLNGFFWPEMAMYFAKPQSVVGSFFIRHHSFRVRIDDIEHYLSGYVAYWKMLGRQRKSGFGNKSVPEQITVSAAPTVRAKQAKTALDRNLRS